MPDMKTKFLHLLTLCLALFLISCGGGGKSSDSNSSSSQQTTISYPATRTSLYNSTTVYPILNSFQGYGLVCTLISGAVPTGMTLDSNCLLTGNPSAVGTFTFGIRISITGVNGSFTVTGSITVDGPTVAYPNRTQHFHIGDTIVDSPIIGWTPPLGVAVQYTFQVTAGSLPVGLTIDSRTGLISGVVAGQGNSSATISVTVTTLFGSYTFSCVYNFTSDGTATFGYSNTGGTPAGIAYISQAFSAAPDLNGNPGSLSAFSLGSTTLPAGLSLNTTTGVISGTPRTAAVPQTYPISATITSNSVTAPATGYFTASVIAPFYISYTVNGVEPSGRIGVAQSISPHIVQISSTPPAAGASYVYVPRAPGANGCTLPPGMMMNPLSGVVSGTPTTAGAYSCVVDIMVTNNAVSWNTVALLYVVIN